MLCAKRNGTGLVAVVVGSLFAASAGADPLPSKYILTYRIHEEHGNPSSQLKWTIALYATPVQQMGNLVNWKVSKVEIVDVVGGRTWLDTIPSGEQTNWWVYHDTPTSPDEGDFCDVPLFDRLAEAQSGTTTDLEYELHTDCGSAAEIPHAWWMMRLYQGEVCTKEDDQVIEVAGAPDDD